MRLTILTENHTYIDRYFLGEPAFSCWVEAEGKRFLFDTGYSDVFLKNARALGLPLERLDALVLSHGHNDHTGGLPHLARALKGRKLPLIAHPEVFAPRTDGGLAVGCPMTRAEAERTFSLRLSKEPVWLTERLVFLGQIPDAREARRSVGTLADGTPDRCMDDSALAYAGREGVYLLTGCSHSGICNLVDYARKVTGQDRVLGNLGGLHLLEQDARAEAAEAYLQSLHIPELWPCHCTGFAVRAAMAQTMPVYEAGVSLSLDWE